MSKNTQLAEREPKKTKSDIKISKRVYIPAIACVIIAIAICAVMLSSIQAKAINAATEEFNSAATEEHDKIYDKFKQFGYDIGFKKSRTQNDILATIDKVKEVEVLEVLDVSASDVKEYKFDNELTDPSNIFLKLINFVTGNHNSEVHPQAVVWLEGNCIGTYEIDLKSSEVIVDSANNYVLVRLPSPSLKFIAHDFEVKYYNNGTPFRKILNGSTQQGLDAAIQDTADMTAHLHDMLNNREQSDLAREQAIALITALIKDINHDNPDITVDVEFFS